MLAPLPTSGRVFRTGRRVRLSDAAADGHLRLDAVARYCQDVANDDVRDAGIADHERESWVVRRTVMAVHAHARYGEWLELATFASGHGPRWAERRTSITTAGGGHTEVASIWVFIDPASGRPAPLAESYFRVWGATSTRPVPSRLRHPSPPDDGSTFSRSWPTRVTDFDVLGHLTNSAYLVPVEELLQEARLPPPFTVEVEYRAEASPGAELTVQCRPGEDGFTAWLTSAGIVHASMVARRGVPSLSPAC